MAFPSSATNLVEGDTNGKVDAFLARSPGRAVRRVSDPLDEDVNSVTVSGDCSRVSFTTESGRQSTTVGNRNADEVNVSGNASDPSYADGQLVALVYAARAASGCRRTARAADARGPRRAQPRC